MNELMEKIAEDAFADELEKIAGELSENIGTVLTATNPAALPLGIASGLVGAMTKTPTEKKMKKQDKHGISNILLGSIFAPYRRVLRYKYEQENKDDE